MWADLIALDTDHLDLEGRRGDLLLDSWIFAGDDRMVKEVWSAGRLMVTEGRHIAREEIESRARATFRKLKDHL